MAINKVARLLAYLLGLLAPFMGLAAVLALVLGEEIRTFFALAVPATAALALALGVWLSRGSSERRLTIRESFLFVGLAWFGASAWGALPYVLSGAVPHYAQAYFEAASGFTTTGASVLTDIEALPRSLLFWRSMTHWLGGMGIVVLTVAIFPLLGYGAARLMEAEAPGPSVDRIKPRITGTAKLLWLLYLGLTLAETILLALGGMDLVDAVIHAFGTMATGGFSSKNASVGAFGSAWIDIVTTLFMVLAGSNFTLLYQALRGKWREVIKNSEFRLYFGIFAVASLIIALDLRTSMGGNIFHRLRFSSFQASSILTTTGYATTDFARWPPLSQGILFVLMFIGGCAGSTGGGIKVGRLLTLLKLALVELRYLVNPRARLEIFVDQRPLRKNAIYDIAGFVVLYFFLAFSGFVALTAVGLDITTALTGSMACIGNIGPGLGALGPTANYGALPDGILAYLSFLMIAGRLEVCTVLVILTPSFWRGR